MVFWQIMNVFSIWKTVSIWQNAFKMHLYAFPRRWNHFSSLPAPQPLIEREPWLLIFIFTSRYIDRLFSYPSEIQNNVFLSAQFNTILCSAHA